MDIKLKKRLGELYYLCGLNEKN